MPVEFFTGFEGCGSDGDVRSFFDAIHSYSPTVGNVSYNATEGFEGGKCIRIYASHAIGAHGSRVYATKNCTPALTKTAGFHVRRIGSVNYYNVTHDGAVVAFMGPDIGIYYHDGSFKIYRGSTEIATHAVAISVGLHHIEVKVEIDDTAGYVGIKLDGTLVYENSALNTGNANITGVRFSRNNFTGSNDARVYDNIFIADDWQGELKSHLLLPTADGAVEFTPSAGSDNYALLQSNDGNTSYVESDVVDEQDMYEFGPDLGMFEVHAVSIVSVARKTDVGARNLQVVMEYDGVEHDLTNHSLSESFPSGAAAGLVQCHGEPPAGGEWSPILLNSMLAGFKVA